MAAILWYNKHAEDKSIILTSACEVAIGWFLLCKCSVTHNGTVNLSLLQACVRN